MRTKETLCRPDVAQLIMRGARACGFPEPAAILADLCLDAGGERQGVFCGTIDDQAGVVSIGFLPHNPFWLAPVVSLAYSDKAPRQLAADVAAGLRGWFEANGFKRVLVANTQHTDRSYIRGLSYFGKGSVEGSVIAFDF